ncbi:MAG TPA: hypothetical protein VHT52_12295 [Stellaceae bacterium]|jgi:hypothetical protein|nr:hypothetical protein [Stellaceae bacterium]
MSIGQSSGNKGAQSVDIPPFMSAGGVTPQQGELGQYTYGENLLGQASQYAGSGTGESTMATQGAEGARNTQAQQMGEMSDTDQSAMYQLYQNDVQNELQGLQNQASTTQGQSTNLGSLASAAGFGTGSQGGFGTGTTTGTQTTL